MPWPLTSCGYPTTAASAQSGWPTRAARAGEWPGASLPGSLVGGAAACGRSGACGRFRHRQCADARESAAARVRPYGDGGGAVATYLDRLRGNLNEFLILLSPLMRMTRMLFLS